MSDWPDEIDEFEREGPFFATAEGQFIAGAQCYLVAARTLLESPTYRERQSVLVKPTLHVLAHGVELLLKFPLIRAGASVADVRDRFGHDLSALWLAPGNATLQALTRLAAREAWEEAAASGKWPDAFAEDPERELEEKFARLAELHGKKSAFALRYLTEPGATGPRAAFLVDTFGRVTDTLAKNPSRVDG